MHLYEPRHAVLRIRGHGRPLLGEHQRLYLLRERLSPGRLHMTTLYEESSTAPFHLACLLRATAHTC